jgi:hypothetical protein
MMPSRNASGIDTMPDEEECGHRKDEAAQLTSQFLELWAGLRREELLAADGWRVAVGKAGLGQNDP